MRSSNPPGNISSLSPLKQPASRHESFAPSVMSTHLLRSCLLAAVLVGTVLGAIPPYIKVCRRSDPNINACIQNTLEHMREKLAQGMPELDAPAIEPLTINHIRLERGPSGARLDLNITDLQVWGPSTFKVRDLKADPENVVFNFKVGFDKLHFSGKYQINARVLLLRLMGHGGITGNFTDYDSSVTMRAHKVERDGGVYLHFENMKINLVVRGANFHLSNLFNGDPVLGAAANDIINTNTGIFLDEIRPVLEERLSELLTNVANQITKTFTYDELFPK